MNVGVPSISDISVSYIQLVKKHGSKVKIICATTRLNSGVSERKNYSEMDQDDFGLSILFDSDDERDESYHRMRVVSQE